MPYWVRDNYNRLIHDQLPNLTFDSDSNLNFGTMSDTNDTNAEVEQPLTLRDRCYPSRTSQPSCIIQPEVQGSFELRSTQLNNLPTYTGIEDAYLFLREFEDVCFLIQINNLTRDSVMLKYIPFALRGEAKKWLYSLPERSIRTWDHFVQAFLKKFFPNHKTDKLRNEINQFIQLERESFWKYFDRFKNLLAQCPHHGLEKWRLCQIIYEGMDYSTRTMVESMCQGEFMSKRDNDAWQFLEDLADKSMQWETTRETERTNPKGGIHQVETSWATEAKIDAMAKRLEQLELERERGNQVNQVMASCTFCTGNHVAEECPHLNPQMENVNATFQRGRYDPFAPTYNPGWRNHPNFSWSQGNHQGGGNHQA